MNFPVVVLMSVQQIFIISRAGSLIYDWEAKNETVTIERSYQFPLGLLLEEIDSKAQVVFGEKDGVKLRYFVTSVNDHPVSGVRFFKDEVEHNVITFLQLEENFPVTLKFSAPTISTNEKIILLSTFHSLFTIAVQLSPASRSSGIEVLETSQFRLCCLQSRTGVKFVVVTSSNTTLPVESLLNKLYELYADYALKNPFYAVDMPIRCQKFEDGLKMLLERIEKNSGSITI